MAKTKRKNQGTTETRSPLEAARESFKDNENYSYIVFADRVASDKRATNTSYNAALKVLIDKGTKQERKHARAASKWFSQRKDKYSAMHGDYEAYWAAKEHAKRENRIVQESSLNILRQLHGHAQNVTRKYLSASEAPQGPTAMTAENDTFSALLEGCKRLADSTLHDLQIVDFTKPSVQSLYRQYLSKEERAVIDDKLAALKTTLTRQCQALRTELTVQDYSLIDLRRIIMDSFGKHFNKEPFDTIRHSDWDTLHHIMSQLLRYAEAPINPLSAPCGERTAGTMTVFPLVNGLFLPYSDILKVKWIEVTCDESEDAKLDGLILAKQGSVPLVAIELAGGIETSYPGKLNDDERKLYSTCISMIQMSWPPVDRLFTILFHDHTAYFESIKYIDSTYVRQRHATVKFPSTPRELQHFAKTAFIDLYNWAYCVVQHAKNLPDVITDVSSSDDSQ